MEYIDMSPQLQITEKAMSEELLKAAEEKAANSQKTVAHLQEQLEYQNARVQALRDELGEKSGQCSEIRANAIMLSNRLQNANTELAKTKPELEKVKKEMAKLVEKMKALENAQSDAA